MAYNRFTEAVDGHKPTIGGLLLSCCPTTIAWFVILVVVYAIQLVIFSWLSAEFAKENGIVIPNNGKFYSTSAIVFPILIVWVTAALAGGRPRLPFRSELGPFAMFGVGLFNAFYAQASARLGASGFQIVGEEGAFVSAIAKAFPTTAVFVNIEKCEDCKATKSLAGNIDDLISPLWHTEFLVGGGCYVNSIS